MDKNNLLTVSVSRSISHVELDWKASALIFASSRKWTLHSATAGHR